MYSLIIEENRTLSKIIKKTLSAYDFNCQSIKTEDISNERDLVSKAILTIFDLTTNFSDTHKRMLSDVLKINPNTIVVGVVQRSRWDDRVEFLKAGGDDVINYPFLMQELLARIQALLRRPKRDYLNEISIGDYSIVPGKHEVRKEGREVKLKRKEYKLFEYLARNRERTISREELLDHVWDYKRIVGSNTVDVHISALRKKLGNPDFLKTVYGIGYKVDNLRLQDSNSEKEIRIDEIYSKIKEIK